MISKPEIIAIKASTVRLSADEVWSSARNDVPSVRNDVPNVRLSVCDQACCQVCGQLFSAPYKILSSAGKREAYGIMYWASSSLVSERFWRARFSWINITYVLLQVSGTIGYVYSSG
jgi:hypothetical protein